MGEQYRLQQVQLVKKVLSDFPAKLLSKLQNQISEFLFCNSAAAAGDRTRKDTLTVSFPTFLPSETFGWAGLVVSLTGCGRSYYNYHKEENV